MTFGPPPSSSNDAHGEGAPPEWDALARYATGESDPEEAARVRVWLESHPADRAFVECLAAPLDDPRARSVDVEGALARLQRRMAGTAELRRIGGAGTSRRWRFATAAGLLAAAAVVMFVATRRRTPPASRPAIARTFTTPVGQRDSLLFADGSRVVLGPDSRLEVPADMTSGPRAVTLHGDAVFVVRHDPARPFTVHVDHALVEDIGTTFAIESDAGAGTRVSVIAGRVRLRGLAGSAPDTGVTLAPGDRGTVDLTGRARAERHAPVADDVAWTSGRLAFRDAPMTQIAGELHRWYGVLLDVADSSLAGRHVTTTFESDEPVDDALTKIGLALGARVERHGDRATLTLKRGSVPIR